MTAPALNQETLKRLLHYDPETGVFTWRIRADGPKAWNTRYAGKEAGYDWSPQGSNVTYRCIRIFDWPFLGHRLAWLYMTGAWPTDIIDHDDGDGLHNSWENLREANRVQNAANAGPTKRNKTGYRGVSIHKPSGAYRAAIFVDGKQTHLGHFPTAEEAARAYEAAAKKHHGKFARTR